MVKRKNGKGAVYHRADGRWEAQFRLPGIGRKSFYGRTRREVLAKLRDASWMMSLGLPVSSRNRTAGDFLNDWLEVTRRRVRPSTLRSYELNVRRLTPQVGHVPVSRLSPAGIQGAYQRLEAQGLSAYTVLQAHRTLHRALSQAVNWGLIQRNPAALVFPPRPRKRQLVALSTDQLRALFASTEGDRMHPLWVLLGTAGLRLGEALGLAWEDIDFQGGRVVVRRALHHEPNKGFMFLAPKTPTSLRTVLLTRCALEVLRDLRLEEPGGEGLVFTNRKGGPLHQSVVGVRLRRALEAARLPRIRVHDLRHTAATALLVEGVHPKVVQDMLGHSTITTTMDTYSHVMPTLQADAVRRLDRILRGQDPQEGPDQAQPNAA
jgi:integrase